MTGLRAGGVRDSRTGSGGLPGIAGVDARPRRSIWASLQNTGRRADKPQVRLNELNVHDMLTFAVIGGVALLVIARILMRN